MEKYIVAIDQGTTGTTVLVLSSQLEVLSRASTEILPEYPQPGWVEHDPDKIWEGTLSTIKSAILEAKIPPTSIAAVSITNQRETTCAWNRKNMVPVSKVIVWQCRRTAELCNHLKSQKKEEFVRNKTGLVLDPYFSGTKMRWILDNVDGAKEKAKKGDLAFGTIDTFLLNRMTMGQVYKTDVSNASRTLLMDLKTLDWDEDLLSLFGVPKSTLPTICSSSEIYGKTKAMQVLPDGIPICGILGDQQAALLGQMCLEKGDAKITYGTGCFLLVNTGKEIRPSKNGLLTTVAWKIGNETLYALEGSAFMGGATVQWLRDGLGIINSSNEVEAIAREAKVEEMGELALVPAMTGLGAPHWDAKATGIITGLTRGTNKSHIARAALEGIAHQNDELLDAMARDLGAELSSIRVDGGAAANDLLMQIQCDLAQTKLYRPKILETTALGSAIAAGLAAKIWGSFDDVKKAWALDKEFNAEIPQHLRERKKKNWDLAVKRCRTH